MAQNTPKYKGIKTSVDDEFWEKFQQIKKELGLSSDSEVVRFVITQYYKKKFQPDQKESQPGEKEQKNNPEWVKVEEGWID